MDTVSVANYITSQTNTAISNSSSSATLAQNWATSIVGLVINTDYSSKAYAIGGVGVSGTINKGAAKEWAILTTGTVDTVEFSSKAWAIGGVGVDSLGGSAKDWAVKTSTVGNTGLKSAKSYATDAQNSATTAANSAATLTATSTTSVLISIGSKTFTTQSDKQFQAGQTLKIVSTVNSENFMIADVTSYSTTSLVVNVTSIGGSGTLASWNISLSGIKGDTGATGANGTNGSVITGGATNINGLIKGNGTTLSSATVRADYAEPTTYLATGLLKNTTGTGVHTIAIPGTDYSVVGSVIPIVDGTATVGVSLTAARSDHIHPTDTTRQAVLTSGTTIKTVNSISLLGSGDIAIQPIPSTVVLITSGTSWTVPAGVTRIRVRLVGGGGGGYSTGSNSNTIYASAAGGGYCESIMTVTPGNTISLSIGAGGVGSTANTGGSGMTAGGTTTFGALSATGGAPGGASVSVGGIGYNGNVMNHGGENGIGNSAVQIPSIPGGSFVSGNTYTYGCGGMSYGYTYAGQSGYQGCIIIEY